VRSYSVSIAVSPEVNNPRVWITPLHNEDDLPMKKFSLKDPTWRNIYNDASRLVSHSPGKLKSKLLKLELSGKFFVFRGGRGEGGGGRGGRGKGGGGILTK
jgi:hypothetical protein